MKSITLLSVTALLVLTWTTSCRTAAQSAEADPAPASAEVIDQLDADSEAAYRARYDQMWALVAERKYDEALAGLIWLWEATDNKASAFEPAIRTEVIESIGRIAAHHAPTRAYFIGVLDGLEAIVRANPVLFPQAFIQFIQRKSDPPRTTFREWIDWPALSRALGEEHRVIGLYDEWKKPSGAAEGLHPYARDDAFELLLKHGRVADAGLFHEDIVREARRVLDFPDLVLKRFPEAAARDMPWLEENAQQEAALLFAVGVAAERAQDAQTVVGLLLSKHDTAEARIALVSACIEHGVMAPRLEEWLEEAERRGVKRDDLREQLGIARRRAAAEQRGR